MMHRFGWSLFVLTGLTGCEKLLEIPNKTLPQAEFSTQLIDFGEVHHGDTSSQDVIITNTGDLALGIGSITLGTDEMEDNFVIWYHPADVSCGTTPTVEDEDDDAAGGSDTGGPDTTADTGQAPSSSGQSNQVISVGAGCTFRFTVTVDPQRVGDILGSVHVEMVTEDAESPKYYRDPDKFHEVILLEAVGSHGAGNIVVSPRTMDFGYPSAGQSTEDYIRLHNVGNGPLNISAPEFAEGCDTAFAIDTSAISEGTILPGQTSTLIPVVYTATDSGDAECEMTIASNDIDMPNARVTLRGNLGTNPACLPPSVDIISPTPGTIHGTLDDLVFEMRLFDPDQAASTLDCSIISAIQMEGEEVADCTPTSNSGYVLAAVPTSTLPLGSDTLVVSVKDDCGNEVLAATSYLNRSSFPASDDDGDGFAEDDETHPDCDDDDVTTYPFATEVYDSKDNDCDELIDENTEGTDDDADGFTEIDGDCNDYDEEVYPGAPEQTDTKDNDCNGIVDDGTGLYDDDGDGFAEVDNDCNDNDPEISPAAIEYCDGIDNNCNGLKDNRDGCIDATSAPMIIGGVQLDATAIGSGESTIMTVQVFDPDGDELTFSWQEDEALTALGHNGFDSTVTQTVTWTAPIIEDNSAGQVYSVYVIVTDAAQNQDWAFGEVTVYPEPVLQELGSGASSDDEEEKSGCGSKEDAANAALIPGLFLFGLGALRRRRESDSV